MDSTLSTAEVSRILGLEERRVRSLVRAGLCRPARKGKRYAFSFQDLVVLRTAEGLVRHRVPPARVKRALSALARELPPDQPISGLRIYADGGQVTVRAGRSTWHPETGQTVLNFGLDDLARRIEALKPSEAPSSSNPVLEGEARLEFERGVELESDDPDEAIAAYRHAIELDPKLADAHVNLGRLLHERGDVAEAATLYRRATELAPEDPIAHFDLGLALEDTARGSPEAIRAYERAIALDPRFADAHFNLASLYEELGRRGEALRHYAAYRRLTRKR